MVDTPQNLVTAVLYDPVNRVFYSLANLAAGGAGAAVTIADGGDVTEGAIADAVVAAGAAGTTSAKLRRLTADLNSLLGQTPPASVVSAVTAALATSKVISAAAAKLFNINCASTTVAGWFLVHDSPTSPAAGPVTPIRAYPVGIGQGLEVSWNPPLNCTTGVSITFSIAATPFIQTDSATAFIAGSVV